jgi:hypothetical protein
MGGLAVLSALVLVGVFFCLRSKRAKSESKARESDNLPLGPPPPPMPQYYGGGTHKVVEPEKGRPLTSPTVSSYAGSPSSNAPTVWLPPSSAGGYSSQSPPNARGYSPSPPNAGGGYNGQSPPPMPMPMQGSSQQPGNYPQQGRYQQPLVAAQSAGQQPVYPGQQVYQQGVPAPAYQHTGPNTPSHENRW